MKRRTIGFDRVISIIITVICLVTALSIIRNTFADGKEELAIEIASESKSVNVGIEKATRSNISSYTKLYGDIITDSDPIAMYPDVSGRITALTIKKGERIEKGDIIGYVNQSKPGYSYNESPITASASGEVLSIEAAVGDTVDTSSTIATVMLDEELKIETSVPERYISVLEPGLTASFAVEAYPGKTYQAEVSYISPIVDTDTRTAEIELTITGNTDGLMKGMFATVSLETESEHDVITVPSSAVESDSNGEYVLTAEHGIAIRKNIESGITDGQRTAVISGLEEGDDVIISGSASEGSEITVTGGV